jgi:IS4 transposase
VIEAFSIQAKLFNLISDTVYETLFTNLPSNKFSAEVLKELYKMRWSIETSFKELKYNVGLASIQRKSKILYFMKFSQN